MKLVDGAQRKKSMLRSVAVLLAAIGVVSWTPSESKYVNIGWLVSR